MIWALVCTLRFFTTKIAWCNSGLAATYTDWDMGMCVCLGLTLHVFILQSLEGKSKEPLEEESWDHKDDASFWRRIADEVRTVF